MKDEIFTQEPNKKFEFDEVVASVFDDMLSRSVPFYDEVQKMIISIILENEADDKRVVDLGSSTARFLIDLHSQMRTKMELCGLDNSEAMLSQARAKCKAYGAKIELKNSDIVTSDFGSSDFVVANYTLQFIRPMQRNILVKKIYQSLTKNGLFLFSEKIVFTDKKLDKTMIDIYHNRKKAHGYSDYEISKKREALENVLVPYTIRENIQMCKEAGFEKVDTIFQWANFATFLAQKARD
ncbi:MAG TPA: carboxy-S-adenosyl-L-methionine synthase CmoA [Epsilonproteobacteria bacterium]|nr:carboxy-S-adenosyl-L-methionine synthase CmoA [Campylobacterota bacterium]